MPGFSTSVSQSGQRPISAGVYDHKQTYDTVPKDLEIEHVIDTRFFIHLVKVGHAKDGEDKHD